MNNKEIALALSEKMGTTNKEATERMATLVSDISQHLQNADVVSIQGFGSFEVKKKEERVSVNPITKLRMLIPPKLVLTYKPHNILKEKFKNLIWNE